MKKIATLADHLPEDVFKKLQDLRYPLLLTTGNIHLLELTEEDGIVLPLGKKSHSKFVVIVGYNKNDEQQIGCVLINSRPNPRIFPTVETRQDFHAIYRKNYSFIKDKDHDPSYIDCGQIFSFSKDRIKIANQHKGELLKRDLYRVIQKINNSDRIDGYIFDEYEFVY